MKPRENFENNTFNGISENDLKATSHFLMEKPLTSVENHKKDLKELQNFSIVGSKVSNFSNEGNLLIAPSQ